MHHTIAALQEARRARNFDAQTVPTVQEKIAETDSHPGNVGSPERLAKAVVMDIKLWAKKSLQGTWMLERVAGIKASLISYSQFGEDVHLLRYYERLASELKLEVAQGLIVDIGAFRPVAFSNSYAFYKRGWHTINVDPTPGSKKIFDRTRPRDTNLEVAISVNERRATFYIFGTPSVWNTMDAEAAERAFAATGIKPREVQVEVRRLDTILDRYADKREFEILMIDAEGLDIEIIASNNFDRYSPRIILVEVTGLHIGGIPCHPAYQYLLSRGYELFSWINPNLFFVRKDSVPSF